MISDGKPQYDINREASKISALSSGKIYTYEYLTGEEILHSDQRRMIPQVKFTYLSVGKGFEKQIKTIEGQQRKQVEAVKVLKLYAQELTIKDAIVEEQLNEETKK